MNTNKSNIDIMLEFNSKLFNETYQPFSIIIENERTKQITIFKNNILDVNEIFKFTIIHKSPNRVYVLDKFSNRVFKWNLLFLRWKKIF